MSDINLEDVFANRQAELQVRLARARSLTHPTSAGDEGEQGWSDVLRDFLPRRYDVARHRFVIDADGRVSEQQDIVIYDGQFAPTFLVLGSTQFIPVESVYAVLEVKPTMDRETVVYAGDKAASVRRLAYNPGKVRIYTGDLNERAPIRPLAGLLCHDSDWADPFGEHFERALGDLDDDARLDMGCVALKGAFSAGVDTVVSADADRALIAFCVALFDSLQKLGNAPGVDAIKYGRDLWKHSDSSGSDSADGARTQG